MARLLWEMNHGHATHQGSGFSKPANFQAEARAGRLAMRRDLEAAAVVEDLPQPATVEPSAQPAATLDSAADDLRRAWLRPGR